MALVPHFERGFTANPGMPQNGPANKKGLAYRVRHQDVLLITVETFKDVDDELLIRETVNTRDYTVMNVVGKKLTRNSCSDSEITLSPGSQYGTHHNKKYHIITRIYQE